MILDYGWGYNEDIGFQWENCGKTYDLRRKMVGLCWISLGKLELILILGLSISLSMDLFKKNMDGWTIWIHLKQCVTLDPSFNYGKVTFIKRIQKVNYLLLRMEDERG